MQFNKYTYIHIDSGCSKKKKRETHIIWSIVVAWKGSTAFSNYLEDYWPCAGGLSTVNAIGTQLHDPINSGLTRWRMAVHGTDGPSKKLLQQYHCTHDIFCSCRCLFSEIKRTLGRVLKSKRPNVTLILVVASFFINSILLENVVNRFERRVGDKQKSNATQTPAASKNCYRRKFFLCISVHTYVVYFQHAHFMPIVGGGKERRTLISLW